MADVKQDSPSNTGADPLATPWTGFAEIDRAIAENRLTAYSWKKEWADPLARARLIAVVLVLLAFLGFVFAYDVVGWQ